MRRRGKDVVIVIANHEVILDHDASQNRSVVRKHILRDLKLLQLLRCNQVQRSSPLSPKS